MNKIKIDFSWKYDWSWNETSPSTRTSIFFNLRVFLENFDWDECKYWTNRKITQNIWKLLKIFAENKADPRKDFLTHFLNTISFERPLILRAPQMKQFCF